MVDHQIYALSFSVLKLFLDSHHKYRLCPLMTASLTSFLPELVAPLGITQAAVYERQRALVRLGLLPAPSGRGRGAGAAASPRSVGLIVLSMLASDTLSGMDDRIEAIANAQFDGFAEGKTCRLTKQAKFIDALSALLADYQLARRVKMISVNRTRREASISWEQKVSGKFQVSRFEKIEDISRPSIEVTAVFVDVAAIRQLAARLAAIEAEGVVYRQPGER